MARRSNPAAYIIFGLLAIGILSRFFSNPMAMLIPIIVFGGIYLLYKFPPGQRRGPAGRYTVRQKEKPKRRTTTFRVIPGNKTDDDDRPRYH